MVPKDSVQLSRSATALLKDSGDEIFLNMASVGKIQIEVDIKKLALPLPLSNLLALQRQTNNVQILPLEVRHIYALSNLPMHDKDPSDHLLIAQSSVEKMPILSADAVFDRYDAQFRVKSCARP